MITLTLLHPLKQSPVQTWNFPDQESVIRIGRSTDNQVILYSAVVSRRHVELRRVGTNWEVINLGTNGTYLDGKRITQVPIGDGAIIRLARSGPNLQIRMGTEPVPHSPKALTGERTAQQAEPPQSETEITSHLVESDPFEKPPDPDEEPPHGTIVGRPLKIESSFESSTSIAPNSTTNFSATSVDLTTIV